MKPSSRQQATLPMSSAAEGRQNTEASPSCAGYFDFTAFLISHNYDLDYFTAFLISHNYDLDFNEHFSMELKMIVCVCVCVIVYHLPFVHLPLDFWYISP